MIIQLNELEFLGLLIIILVFSFNTRSFFACQLSVLQIFAPLLVQNNLIKIQMWVSISESDRTKFIYRFISIDRLYEII